MLLGTHLLWEPDKMKKFAVAGAAVALMSLAACGEKPAADTNNVANEVVPAMENASNALDNAANAVANSANAVANTADTVANTANAAE